MFQQILTRPRRWSLATAGALALGLLLLSLDARAQETLRQTLSTPTEARPIQLNADDITTWADGSKQIFLMRGAVWIEQGALNLRAAQAVAWVDQASKKESGSYALQVYAENVALEDGKGSRTEKSAFFQMATRGDVRIKSYANKVAQKTMAGDAFFARAANALPKVVAAPPASPLAGLIMPDKKLSQGTGASEESSAPNAQGPEQPPPIVTPIPPDGPVSGPPPPVPAPMPIPSGFSALQAPPGDGTPKQLTIRPRSGTGISAKGNIPLTNGDFAHVINSGVMLLVTEPATGKVLLDIAADRLCTWTRGDSKELIGNLTAPQGVTTSTLEFYLSGNVEIRNKTKTDTETIRADEVYYDVNRNVAIALRADLEIQKPIIPYPIHFKSDELQQLNAKLFLAKQVQVYSTVLPSDPGLILQVREAQIEEFNTIKKSIFGRTVIDSKTGQPLETTQHIFTGTSDVVRLEGVPIFYAPYLKTSVERPLGPLDTANFNYNRIFGLQVQSTWDMHELLGLQRPETDRWKLYLDEMTARGPAVGTLFESGGKNLLGINNRYDSMVKLYGIYDRGLDILGGNRGQQILISSLPPTNEPIEHPDWRGRLFGNLNMQEMPLGFSVQLQGALVSDRNFLEQYFPGDFMNGPNQETSLYVKQQNNFWAWTFLADANFQRWMTATDWLPKADGYALGVKIFDVLTYDVHGSAGYGQLRPTTVVPFAYQATDQRDNSGRFDLWQDISLPFSLGDVRVVPYLTLDLTQYTQDLTGSERGRFYGGAGTRASVPMTRLYPDVRSDFFNLDGINHKMVFSGNFYAAHSDTPLSRLPQLDQLNDNTTDQALRDIRPWQPQLNPANATILTTSPVFDPQLYALRRLVDNSVDTLDSIEVMQLGLRQRWQTKRGSPGGEHIIDWMTLDLQASIFPHSQRDSFGSHWGDIQYDWVWNIGDRTALVSNGWFEPIDNGPRVFNLGSYLGRPDKTSFYLGYRQIDPLQSKAVIASVTYAFSAKYAVTFGANFDFGDHIQSNSLTISRIGTDVTVSLGFSYNSIVNTFGVQFEVVPNLLPMTGRGIGSGSLGGMTSR